MNSLFLFFNLFLQIILQGVSPPTHPFFVHLCTKGEILSSVENMKTMAEVWRLTWGEETSEAEVDVHLGGTEPASRVGDETCQEQK